MLLNVRKDKILIVDFEMTCWDKDDGDESTPEIIDIGIVEVDVARNEVSRQISMLIKNEYSDISEYCTSLTGITQKDINKHGIALSEAARLIEKKMGSKNKTWMAWGNDNIQMIIDVARKQINNPFSDSYINLGQLFTFNMRSSKAVSLNKACEILNITREEVEHRALPDAINTAKFWCKYNEIIQNNLVNEPPEPSVTDHLKFKM